MDNYCFPFICLNTNALDLEDEDLDCSSNSSSEQGHRRICDRSANRSRGGAGGIDGVDGKVWEHPARRETTHPVLWYCLWP
jgi:hypothetical protein